MQISLFELESKQQIENKDGEIVLIKDIKINDFMTTSIIKIDGIPYIKQQLKEKYRWPEGHKYEEDNRPFINELCEKCLQSGLIAELNDVERCSKHGKPERFRSTQSEKIVK